MQIGFFSPWILLLNTAGRTAGPQEPTTGILCLANRAPTGNPIFDF